MATAWHYLRDGEQHGPVSSAQLKALAASGQLTGGDLVWREGMSERVQASKVRGLFSSGPNHLPAQPPLHQPAQEATPTTQKLSPEPKSAGTRINLAGLRLPKSIVFVSAGVAIVVTCWLTLRFVFGQKNMQSSASVPAVSSSQAASPPTPGSRPPQLPQAPPRQWSDAGKVERRNVTRQKTSDGGTASAPKPRRTPAALSAPPLPDFSKLDYSVRFTEADYKCDFSKVDYSKGPQGQKLERRLMCRTVDGKTYPKENLTAFARTQVETTEEIWGFVDSSGQFVRHGPQRVVGKNERAILKGQPSPVKKNIRQMTKQEQHDYADGIVLPELAEVLAETYFFNGKPHGWTRKWGPTRQTTIQEQVNNTPETKQTTNNRVPGPLLLEGAYLNGGKHGKWTEWQMGEEDRQNWFKRPVFKAKEEYFIKGKQHGPLFVYYPDGRKRLEGMFKDDKPHGKWQWLTLNGEQDSDDLCRDAFDQKLIGRGEIYNFNGGPHGKMTVWNAEGKKWLEMTFVNGQPHGVATAWHPDGQKRWELLWINGARQGPFISVWPNGKQEVQGAFKDNERDGDWNEWDDTGKKLYEGRYISGKADGRHREWYRNPYGLKAESNWDHGQKHGMDATYYPRNHPNAHGRELVPIVVRMWEHGECVSTKSY